jgi:hypothetical protein
MALSIVAAILQKSRQYLKDFGDIFAGKCLPFSSSSVRLQHSRTYAIFSSKIIFSFHGLFGAPPRTIKSVT